MSSEATNRPQKRIRLSRACNKCRSRKVRCDEQQPSCSNCIRAGIECITTDPNNPTEVVTHARRRAGTGLANSPSGSGASHPVNGANGHVDAPSSNAGAYQSPIWQQSTPLQETPSLNRASVRMAINDLVESLEPGIEQQGQRSRPSAESAILPSIVDSGQSPGFAVNSVSATERKYLGSTSLQVFSQWLDMTFHVTPTDLTSSFQHGMRFCEEMELPEDLYMPPIPADWDAYAAAYFSCVGKFFSLASRESIMLFSERMQRQDLRALPVRQRPLIATVYACLAIGADSLGHSAQGIEYITAAYSLYAYLVAQPYLQSAQALILICLALRGRNKDGAGSQALGQAIRILHSLGLHRRLNGHGNSNMEQSELVYLGLNIWWSAYCLDRIMSLETGRPPQIQDEDVDQTRNLQTEDAREIGPLQALTSLASLQGSICRHLSTTKLPTIAAVLEAQSRLDKALVEWQSDLPMELRCDGDITINGPELALPRAFLTIQYHSTMINLHRAALLMDKEIHRTNLARYNLQKSDANRLSSSESICANSARAIITAYLQAREITESSRLQTLTGPLMAIYVLSIVVLKNPTSWSTRSDVGLIYSAAEAVEQRYTADGQDPGFYTLLKTLKQFASQNTLSPKSITTSRAPTRRTTPLVNHSHTYTPQPGSDHRNADPGNTQVDQAYDPNLSDEWDMLFPRLYVGDLALDGGGFEGVDIEHLMGIPHLSFDDPH